VYAGTGAVWENPTCGIPVFNPKRAYTLLVASSADGNFLPFQQVWAGATAQSLPSAGAAHMDDARE